MVKSYLGEVLVLWVGHDSSPQQRSLGPRGAHEGVRPPIWSIGELTAGLG